MKQRVVQLSLPALGLFLATTLCGTSVFAQDNPIKVFLMGGQSNMVGQAPTSGLPSALQGAQGDVLFFGGNNGTVGTSWGHLQPSGESAVKFGPEVTFGRSIADAFPDTQFGLIKYAASGTALYDDWSPGTPTQAAGAEYTNFVQTVTNGLAELIGQGYSPEIVGMLWHQGESDALEGQAAAYSANLTNFIAAMRANYRADLPFMIGEIQQNANHRNFDPNDELAFDAVVSSQTSIAASDANTTFVPTADLTLQDRLHFDAAAMITLGERFAQYYEADYGQLVVPEPASLSLLSFGGLFIARRRRRY
jgi:hypothetical protein